MVKVSCPHSCISKHWHTQQTQRLALKTEEMIQSKEEWERCWRQPLDSFAPNLPSLQILHCKAKWHPFKFSFHLHCSELRCAFVKEILEYFTLFGILTSQPSYYTSLTLDYSKPSFLFTVFVKVMWLPLLINDWSQGLLTPNKDRSPPAQIRKGYCS